MRFIYRNEVDFHTSNFLLEQVATYAFWRDIQKLVFAKKAIIESGENLLARHTGINSNCLDASVAQVANLVFHQGNEWSDDYADTGKSQSGYLKGDGLATTCRHKTKGVVPTAYAFDNFVLNAPKTIVTPILL